MLRRLDHICGAVGEGNLPGPIYEVFEETLLRFMVILDHSSCLSFRQKMARAACDSISIPI